MEGLEVCLNRIRENFDEAIVNSSKPIAQAIGITDSLQEKRVKKRSVKVMRNQKMNQDR
jgi:hypothetical protein